MLTQCTIKQISETLKISSERVHHIIHTGLDMKKISVKWIPKCLNAYQKRARVETSRSLCALFDEDSDFLIPVINMDETSLYLYDPETKQQSMEWRHSGSSRTKNFRVQKSVASVFWDSRRVIMVDYLQKDKSVTGE